MHNSRRTPLCSWPFPRAPMVGPPEGMLALEMELAAKRVELVGDLRNTGFLEADTRLEAEKRNLI